MPIVYTCTLMPDIATLQTLCSEDRSAEEAAPDYFDFQTLITLFASSVSHLVLAFWLHIFAQRQA